MTQQPKRKRGRPPVVLPGSRWGRLVVVEDTGDRAPRGSRMLRCVCDCGNSTVVQAGHLKNGHTRSCGCLHREVAWLKGARVRAEAADPQAIVDIERVATFVSSPEAAATTEIAPIPRKRAGVPEATDTRTPARRARSDSK